MTRRGRQTVTDRRKRPGTRARPKKAWGGTAPGIALAALLLTAGAPAAPGWVPDAETALHAQIDAPGAHDPSRVVARLETEIRRAMLEGTIPAAPVTFRHLLTHASGLPGAFGPHLVWGETAPLPLGEYLADSLEVVRPPLEEVVYSNLAFTLVAHPRHAGAPGGAVRAGRGDGWSGGDPEAQGQRLARGHRLRHRPRPGRLGAFQPGRRDGGGGAGAGHWRRCSGSSSRTSPGSPWPAVGATRAPATDSPGAALQPRPGPAGRGAGGVPLMQPTLPATPSAEGTAPSSRTPTEASGESR